MNATWQAATIEVPVADPRDVRVGHLVEASSLERLGDDRRIVLLGFPSDEGVRRNGGRVGAAAACDRIRHWLYRMTPDASAPKQHEQLLRQMADLGNLVCSGDVERDQQQLADVVCELLRREQIPIILGGGHETALGHFMGYAQTGNSVAIVNVDAHADVRPLVEGQGHSGSPFRQALEHTSRACRSYTVFGLNRFANSAESIDFLRRSGATFHWSDQIGAQEIGEAFDQDAPVLATFDLDALGQDDASGVSAPNPLGISKAVWFSLARAAGRSAAVRSIDIVELNPRYDNDDQTARIAALTIWEFTRGLAQR